MTRPTEPRTLSLYHDGPNAAVATWLLLVAVTAFYLTAAAQPAGLVRMVTAQLALGAIPVAFALRRRALGPMLGLIAPRRLAVLGALLIGGTAWYPNLRLALWVQSLRGGAPRVEGLERLLEAPNVAIVLTCVAIVPALCEELAFRGLWARALAGRVGLPATTVITALVFGAYHLSSPQWISASLLGVVLAWASLRGRSLWLSIIVHAVNNATAILAARGDLGALVRVIDAHPDLLVAMALITSAIGVLLIAASARRPRSTPAPCDE